MQTHQYPLYKMHFRQYIPFTTLIKGTTIIRTFGCVLYCGHYTVKLCYWYFPYPLQGYKNYCDKSRGPSASYNSSKSSINVS